MMNYETLTNEDLETLFSVMKKAARDLESYLIDKNAGETGWNQYYHYRDIITKINLQLTINRQRL